MISKKAGCVIRAFGQYLHERHERFEALGGLGVKLTELGREALHQNRHLALEVPEERLRGHLDRLQRLVAQLTSICEDCVVRWAALVLGNCLVRRGAGGAGGEGDLRFVPRRLLRAGVAGLRHALQHLLQRLGSILDARVRLRRRLGHFGARSRAVGRRHGVGGRQGGALEGGGAPVIAGKALTSRNDARVSPRARLFF